MGPAGRHRHPRVRNAGARETEGPRHVGVIGELASVDTALEGVCESELARDPGRVTAFRPFGSVAAHLSPDTLVEYRYSTSRPDSREAKGFETAPADLSEADPRVSMAAFSPAIEKAHHQEVAFSHREGNTSVQGAFYSDRVVDPALTGVGEVSNANGEVLPDIYSGTFTYQGRDLETQGMRLVLEQKLTSDISATLDYSYGGVLDLKDAHSTLDEARSNSEG